MEIRLVVNFRGEFRPASPKVNELYLHNDIDLAKISS